MNGQSKDTTDLIDDLQPYQPAVAEPPTAEEKRIVHHLRTLRARIHDGPFYTILGDNVRVVKTGRTRPQPPPAAAHFDAFEGQPTWTQRYRRKRNTLPKLSSRPFAKDFFPRELWSTIDPSDQTHVKKTLRISTRTRLDRYLANSELYGDEEGRPAEDVEENEEPEKGAEDEAEEKVAEGEEGRDEDADPDQFDEDDEDDDDDYNAEQYFEGGDDDDYGDDGGGGGGDDEGM